MNYYDPDYFDIFTDEQLAKRAKNVNAVPYSPATTPLVSEASLAGAGAADPTMGARLGDAFSKEGLGDFFQTPTGAATAAFNLASTDFSDPESLGAGVGSTAGAIAGNALLPGVGGIIGGVGGDFLGKTVGGLFGDSKEEKAKKKAEKQQENQAVMGGLQNMQANADRTHMNLQENLRRLAESVANGNRSLVGLYSQV